MTEYTFSQKLAARQTLIDFMWSLSDKYSADEFKQLWKAMEVMRNKYGDIFVASAIQKDRNDAELALLRYYRNHCKKTDMACPVVQEPAEKFHPENRHRIVRNYVALLVAGIIALVLLTTLLTTMQVRQSDSVIERADRILSEVR